MGQQARSQATKPDLGSPSLVSREGGSVTLSLARSLEEVDTAKRNLFGHVGKSPG